MDFDTDDNDDDDMRDKEKLPTVIVVNKNHEHLSPIAPPVIVDQSPASPIQEYKIEEEDAGDEDDSFSASSSSSSRSLDLNPNTSVDMLDLPGIALLKEIFPEETTDTLRNLHYQHIMFNKASSSSESSPVFPEAVSKPNPTMNVRKTSAIVKHMRKMSQDDQENEEVRQQKSATCHMNIPIADLPDDDFLRLPKSVAVLRQRKHTNTNKENNVRTYEFIKDLEMRALEEYHLATTTSSANQQIHPGRKYVEYNTYVVDKDDRLGLGMTLQEVVEDGDPLRRQQQESPASGAYFVMGHLPQHTVIRYGLMVIGFLPDPTKIQSGESLSKSSQSPAEIAGIQCDDVVIGINGTAFLLQVPFSTSSSYNVDRRSDHYKIQKERIIQSIQNSPTPVVLHIRRRRERSSIEKSFSERNVNSLLDTTTIQDLERGGADGVFIEQENFAATATHGFPPRHAVPSLQPSSSSAFYKAAPAPTPPKKSPSMPHPLSVALARRKLIRPGEDQWRITWRLQQFTERARQCESSNSLRIFLTGRGGGGEKGSLVPHFDPNDLPPDIAALVAFPKDGVTGSGNLEQQRDKDTSIDEQKTKLASPLLNNHDGKNQQQVEQNNVHFESQRYVGSVTCTPSTPPLSLDSPLIPVEYLQAFYGYEYAQEIRSKSNLMTRSDLEKQSSPSRLFWPQQSVGGLSESRCFENGGRNTDDMAWIPLHGIRKALSARIVNSFVESEGPNSNKNSNMKSRIAYTMWVYDLESGREWYAPIRYWEDFWDLREAALTLIPTISNLHKELSILKFAKDPVIPDDSNSGWGVSIFGSPSVASPMSPLQQRRRKRRNDEFDEERQQTSQSLEEFLRELLGIIYTCDPLHPSTAEIALYVQSFLGVDAGLEDSSESFFDIRTFNSFSERQEYETQQLLKRGIQRYSWRIFLLHTMKAIVKDFVDAARARGPKLHEIESMDAGMKASLKARAMDELLQIQRFLDQLVDLILDGCNDDLRSIAKRREYSPIHKNLVDESYWDRLVR
jgi:hypothetical protein